ncbi:monooxygenase [Aureobasidium namibiae CBS 147.97]|uniref:Monooxygenase n=1 Tax=Aureobasidium namibiae CBS 147.97 TaxID=1043004 RepID=A0A074XEY1_9PEZI
MAIRSEVEHWDIVIVGAGIAGLASAIALRQNGRSILVLEKSSMNKEVGALISLQPNASKIVDGWNMSPFLSEKKPMVDEAFRLLNVKGELQVEMKLNTSQFGADRMLYHRQDLHDALRQAATSKEMPGEPAVIRTSSGVTGCDCDSGIVYLSNGSSVRGSVIVGADGIRSAIRDEVIKGSKSEGSKAIPTGLSAYRVLVETDKLPKLDVSEDVFDLKRSATTMIVGHDKRVIMGPGRGGEMFGLVCLVPDPNPEGEGTSWNNPAPLEEVLDAFQAFPQWVRDIISHAPEAALWQLRDIDPLTTWTKGRAIIIGDAAHAMLPTQGQGASQSIEDAEALQAFLSTIDSKSSADDIHEQLLAIVNARYERASLIQAYSRLQAKPAASQDNKTVQLNPQEFMQYNCNYSGAKDWVKRQRDAEELAYKQTAARA